MASTCVCRRKRKSENWPKISFLFYMVTWAEATAVANDSGFLDYARVKMSSLVNTIYSSLKRPTLNANVTVVQREKVIISPKH